MITLREQSELVVSLDWVVVVVVLAMGIEGEASAQGRESEAQWEREVGAGEE